VTAKRTCSIVFNSLTLISPRYWDWTLDWESPSAAPIWDNEYGFGGDGAKDQISTVGFGTCVLEGPFANLSLAHYKHETQPHCLSRGFGRQINKTDELYGRQFHPKVLDGLLQRESFFNFSLSLEMGPHVAIPNWINGDFISFEAPNGNHVTICAILLIQTMITVADCRVD